MISVFPIHAQLLSFQLMPTAFRSVVMQHSIVGECDKMKLLISCPESEKEKEKEPTTHHLLGGHSLNGLKNSY